MQSIHFDADKRLLEFIQERVDKLGVFSDHIIDGEVLLRLDKAESKENKIAEIKVNLPGKLLFAKEQCKTFEEATDSAIDSLRKQITKHKEKAQS